MGAGALFIYLGTLSSPRPSPSLCIPSCCYGDGVVSRRQQWRRWAQARQGLLGLPHCTHRPIMAERASERASERVCQFVPQPASQLDRRAARHSCKKGPVWKEPRVTPARLCGSCVIGQIKGDLKARLAATDCGREARG